MKPFLLILISLVVFAPACKNADPDAPPKAALPENDSAAIFLSFFPNVNPNHLQVFSPDDATDDPYQGKRIQTAFYKYFLSPEAIPPMNGDTLDQFHACYKFDIDPDQTGLLIRGPSEYASSAIDLYVWNKKTKKTERVQRLADSFGDAGWFFIQDGWLLDLNHDGKIDYLTRRKDFDQDMDDTTKITQSDTLVVYLNKNHTFVPTRLKIDTPEFKIKYWEKKLGQ